LAYKCFVFIACYLSLADRIEWSVVSVGLFVSVSRCSKRKKLKLSTLNSIEIQCTAGTRHTDLEVKAVMARSLGYQIIRRCGPACHCNITSCYA